MLGEGLLEEASIAKRSIRACRKLVPFPLQYAVSVGLPVAQPDSSLEVREVSCARSSAAERRFLYCEGGGVGEG